MSTLSSQKTRNELNAIDKSIRRTNRLVVGWIALWVVIYFGWFFYLRGAKLPIQAASWGVMGDFFGGILNPIVALCAFNWLTKSVRLQKEELADAKDALAATALAQSQQVLLSSASVRLTALSALTNSIMSEVATQRLLMQFYVEQINPGQYMRDIDGKGIDMDTLSARLATINARIETRMTERMEYETQITALLKEHHLSGKELADRIASP